VARGQAVSSKEGVSKQIDVVIYDALHSPVLQDTETSRVFASEYLYAAIEVKSHLNSPADADAVANIKSVKSLDRSAVVPRHGGHQMLHGPPVSFTDLI